MLAKTAAVIRTRVNVAMNVICCLFFLFSKNIRSKNSGVARKSQTGTGFFPWLTYVFLS
jgi:hypothetical protein